jgi:surfeit locus 1 family protein
LPDPDPSIVTAHPRPLWLPAAILAALVPLFVGLGLWQLQRADEKRALQQEYDLRIDEAPQQLGASPQQAAALRFRRLLVRGVYDPDYQILIDNRVHRGVPGYHVITPLKLEGGDTRVLVNRGWVALGASRAHLPAVEPPPGVQEISGVAAVPADKGFTLGDDTAPAHGWKPVWLRLDLQRYAAAVPFAVQPVVLLLDANMAHGYTRDWSRLDAGIAVHQGYAFQWFALALLALVLAIMLLARQWRRRHAVTV